MSDVIQLLPDSVANQIAAGEVIQRPANVVKELMENSVDAGADKIDVYITDAGKTSIQVVDNGKGMSETDARLAFERHATSKIRKADDLYTLQTMGFRGEALPSIAAVSMVEMSTRQAADELGTNLVLTASKVAKQQVCACPVGCNIRVQNIFFNIPARRKFLKSNATELNNIITAFERIALVYPDIEFSFHSNDSEVMNLKTGNIHKRIADIFGKKLSQSLLPIDVKTSICNIYGFVGKPENAKKKCSMQYFFVNGRFMKHAYFGKAVMSAYERLVPTGEQVPYFIYFDADPSTIDVNIHPAKTEIKFENEQAIWQILSAAVREAVGIFSELPTIDFDTEGKPDIPVFNNGNAITIPEDKYRSNISFAQRDYPKNTKNDNWEGLYKSFLVKEPVQKSLFDAPEEGKASLTISSQAAHYYQHKGQYIVTSVNNGLMLIDQYKAHVRILYERYMKQMAEKKPISQRLLFPEAVKFTARKISLLETIIAEMENLGFELTPLGADNYAINAVPDGLDGINPSSLLADMMEDVLQAGGSIVENINHTLALSLARKVAIPYGQILTNEEIENLVKELFACENTNYTPDGKKTFCIVPEPDILRYFT